MDVGGGTKIEGCCAENGDKDSDGQWFRLSGGIACRMVSVVPLLLVVVSSTSGERACHS